MRKKFVPFVVAVFIGVFASVAATASAGTVKCPSGYTCISANKTVHQSAKSTSSTKIVIKKTINQQVKQYMTVHHVAVTIDQVAGGITSSTGCIDPVAKGYIKPGGDFSNTGGLVSYRFTDHWPDGVLLCNYHVVHALNGSVYLDGTKSSCGNQHVYIFLTPHKYTKYLPVRRFYTLTSWKSTYRAWATKKSKSTRSTSTKYSCNKGWKLHGTQCWQAVKSPKPTPTPGPKYVCTINGVGQTSVPSGYVNNAGVCQQQTVAPNCPYGTNSDGSCVAQGAQATCQQSAQNYPGSTWTYSNNTCTITQIQGNCSNTIVIQGNGSPQVTQGGNCNSSPPTPPSTCTDTTATNYGSPGACVYPPPPTASLTLPTINMVNANNSSNCKPIQVDASSSGDVLTVNPQYATVAQCDANGNVGSQADSLTVSVPQGISTIYVDFFEGDDADQPQQDSAAVTVTNQGSALASGTIAWQIQYPSRPS